MMMHARHNRLIGDPSTQIVVGMQQKLMRKCADFAHLLQMQVAVFKCHRNFRNKVETANSYKN